MNTKNDLGLAVLRIGFSALLLTHGIPKFMTLLSGEEIQFPDPLGIGATPTLILAVIGEFLCPILIILGYKTKWATIPPMITMLVAAFVFHAKDSFGDKEFPLLYFIGFLAVFLLGAGKHSLDHRLTNGD